MQGLELRPLGLGQGAERVGAGGGHQLIAIGHDATPSSSRRRIIPSRRRVLTVPIGTLSICRDLAVAVPTEVGELDGLALQFGQTLHGFLHPFALDGDLDVLGHRVELGGEIPDADPRVAVPAGL